MLSESRSPCSLRSRPEWKTDLRKDPLEARVGAEGVDTRINAKPDERRIAIVERLGEEINRRLLVSERKLGVRQVSGGDANRTARRFALQFG